MTVNIHAASPVLDEHLAQGYVEVGRWFYPAVNGNAAFERVELAHPDKVCLHRMKPWWQNKIISGITVRYEHHGYCLLDKGHKGKRHSTTVFVCDICDKARRGEPSYSDDSVAVCWFCRNIGYKHDREAAPVE